MISWPGGKGMIGKQQHTPELSHPGGQPGGSQVRRFCSGTTHRPSKPKLKGRRSSLVEDENRIL